MSVASPAFTVASVGEYADVTARINELTGSVESLKQVQDIATASGWDQVDVVRALATGDGLPALTKAFNENNTESGIASARNFELQGVLDGTKQGFELAAGGAQVQASALYELATQAGTATGEVDGLGNAIVKMPDGKEIVVDAQTKTAYENIDAIEQRQINDKTFRMRGELDTSAIDNYLSGTKILTVKGLIENGRSLQ